MKIRSKMLIVAILCSMNIFSYSLLAQEGQHKRAAYSLRQKVASAADEVRQEGNISPRRLVNLRSLLKALGKDDQFKELAQKLVKLEQSPQMTRARFLTRENIFSDEQAQKGNS